MSKKLPKRKPLRLPHHDYGTAGAYFVTVCTLPGTEPLSALIPSTVGAGASTAPNLEYPIQTLLTPAGMIVEKHLLSSEQIPGVTVDSYVIMPDHIHVIFIIEPQSEDEGRRGAAPTRLRQTPNYRILFRPSSALRTKTSATIFFNAVIMTTSYETAATTKHA